MASLNTSVSLQNPTWEYLNSNYTKIDLQKHCREIGITQIWVTKEKLIDKILEIHQSSRPKDFENSVQTQETTSRNTRDEIQELRERVSIRDSEIDKLNELLISANATISEMNDRLSLVEEQMRKLQVHSGTQQTPSIPHNTPPSSRSQPEGTLLLGDANLTDVRISDLDNYGSVRTIRGANIDIIKCWVSEKLPLVPKKNVSYT